MLYPSHYCENIFQVDEAFLMKHQVKGIILDVDNTLVDRERILSQEVIDWHRKLIQRGIKTIILSNSIRGRGVARIAKELGTEYINFARKPFKFGMKQALHKMNLEAKEVAMIGDQIFTDVLGARRMGLFSVLVEPVSSNEPWRVKWQRPIERLILKKYKKRNSEKTMRNTWQIVENVVL